MTDDQLGLVVDGHGEPVCSTCGRIHRIARGGFFSTHEAWDAWRRQQLDRGRPHTPEALEKIAASHRGRPKSDEHKAKLSEAARHFHETGGWPHGTAQRYRNGCRCDECREAQRAYTYAYRERERAAALEWAEFLQAGYDCPISRQELRQLAPDMGKMLRDRLTRLGVVKPDDS